MSDDDALPPDPDSAPPDSPVDRTGNKESRRRRLESVIPDIVRRAVEIGVEKAQEAPDNLKQFVGDRKLPKEIGHYLLAQIDETKNGLFRVVAKEMRDFLEHTNFAGEMQKLLTTVQFEVNTTIRFTPNDGKRKARESEPPKDIADPAAGAPPEPEGDETSSEPDASDEARVNGDDAGPGGGGRTPLPKPEVKTSLHVRRDGREEGDRRRTRDRST